MNSHTRMYYFKRKLFRKIAARIASFFLILSTVFGPLAAFPATPALAQGPYDVTISVVERGTGTPVTEFKFIINKDIAHDNPSVTPPESYSPLVAQGDQDSATVSLEDGKYLVTVLSGPFPPTPSNYKMWGKHFMVAGGDQMVTVELVPNPLPLSTLQARVFHDNLVVNGEDDIPLEEGLAGFHVVLSDPVGEVTVDFFGDPLCGGVCLTDATGYVTIPNLPPGKYEVQAIPPDGSGWVQTTTIEGTHAIDAWLEEGSDGLSTEEGFTQAAVWFGFVRPCSFGDPGDDCPTNDTAGTGSISGKVRRIVDIEAPGTVTLGEAVPQVYLALNNIGGNDEQVWMGPADPVTGEFFIPDVPPGLYQLVYWDFPQDYIIQFHTVQVGPGEAVDVGDIGMPRWFGTIKGYTYIDSGVTLGGTAIPGGAENGRRDCLSGPHDVMDCEPGLPGQDLDIRFKDGSIKYATFTDSNGFYEFPEYFEWEHFLVWEVGFGRMRQVGTTGYFADDFGNPLGYPDDPVNEAEPGLGALLQAQLTWGGYTNWIDSGKVPYQGDENGGISGIVYYATTRNEFDPRLAAAEDYEPGIPGVTVNLFAAVVDENDEPVACTSVGPGCPYGQGELMRASDTPLNSVETDSWYDNRPTDCDVLPFLGLPGYLDPDCKELPRTLNQIKDGVFDGGYAFETICPGGFPCDETEEVPMPAGFYIVEVVPPEGYREIREEDQNTDQGDDFVPAVPPPPCSGPLHLVDDPRNPAHGTYTPLCNSRFVTLQNGFNAGAEFFLMIDNALPPPGLLRGLLLDDLVVQIDPSSPIYADKRGIPNAPIGILDFAGNHITTVYSDANGYWEVLLPSTYTALCPIPSGICPGMYQVIGNYPGDPLNPDPKWNPNYGTLRLVFDIWPGKTTYADVAIFPTTGFVQTPDDSFASPPICEIPEETPNIQSVSQPYGSPGETIAINGSGFGTTEGMVTLDGAPMPASNVTWISDTLIEIEILPLSLISEGPHQLLVTNSSGRTSPSGITLHVIGGSYTPGMIFVPGDYATIQEAIDNASDGDLILVSGTHYENLIVDKRVKLQGYGPNASLIDGRFFNFGGTTPEQFQDRLDAVNGGSGPVGPESVPMGQVVTFVAGTTTHYETGTFNAQIDGFAIRGGSRVRGNRVTASQGGGIYAHAYASNLEISNNLVQSNAGNAGGGIILGQPFMNNPDAGNARDNENDNVRIHHNRVLNNGGLRLAGAVGLFNGSESYEIDHNVICGNYSAEYGGGISHYGMSPGGHIHDNEVLFNYAFDEGGGIMIAGEQPIGNPLGLSPGSGEVLIERNRIQTNVSNDDGGGIRLLQPVEGPVTIQNNMVVNNIATDFGGGISLDDALDVRIINNTIAKNLSTATAEDADRTSCGAIPPLATCPHAAGLASEPHSQALRNAYSLPADSFSDPILFNNIFWENQAYSMDGSGGLPSAGTIDLEVVGTGTPQTMEPNYSFLTVPYGSGIGNTTGVDPSFVEEIDTTFIVVPFAGDPQFTTVLVTTTPADPQGDYHLDGSDAEDAGVSSFGGFSAPVDDFDGDARPQGTAHDIGADEVPDGPPGPMVDLSISKTDGMTEVFAGDDLTYTITVANNSATETVSDVPVTDSFPAELTGVAWTCTASSGSACDAAAGAGDISATVDLAPLGTATFSASGTVDSGFTGLLSNSASVTVPPGITDPDLGNNSATDETDVLPAQALLYFSTQDGKAVPGVPGPHDDADIYSWDGSAFARLFDGSAAGLPAGADIDGMHVVDEDTFYLSFTGQLTLPGAGTNQDEDIVLYDAGVWSLYFDGTAVGLNGGSEDVDAFSILSDGSLVVSVIEQARVPGLPGTFLDEDLLRCVGTFGPSGTSCTWSLYFDGSDVALANENEDVDGTAVSGSSLYLSTVGNFNVSGLSGQGRDVFVCEAAVTGDPSSCGSFAMFFDGSAWNFRDLIDAFDVN